jgi:hypothetical protein
MSWWSDRFDDFSDSVGTGGAQTSIWDQAGNAVNTSIGGDSSIGKALTEVSQGAVQTVENIPQILEQVTEASLAQAKAFVKNPIPTLATIALNQFMPYNYASAIVNVANGGDWKKAVVQMGMDYYTRDLNTGVPKSTLEKVFTSASTSAISAKLLGATDQEVINAAFGGAVNTYVSDLLYKPESQGGFGLDPNLMTSKLLTNATSATTNAILRGKPIGDAIIQSAMVTAGSYYVKQSFDEVTKKSETLQTAQKYLDEAKAKVKSLWTPSLQDKKLKAEEAERVLQRTHEPLRKQEAQMAYQGAKNDYDSESFEYRQAMSEYQYRQGVANSAEQNADTAEMRYLRANEKLDSAIMSSTRTDDQYGFTADEIAQITSDEINIKETDALNNDLENKYGYTDGSFTNFPESEIKTSQELQQELDDEANNNFYINQNKRLQDESDAYDKANPGWRERTAEQNEAIRKQELDERLRLQKLAEEQDAQVKAAQAYDLRMKEQQDKVDAEQKVLREAQEKKEADDLAEYRKKVNEDKERSDREADELAEKKAQEYRDKVKKEADELEAYRARVFADKEKADLEQKELEEKKAQEYRDKFG